MSCPSFDLFFFKISETTIEIAHSKLGPKKHGRAKNNLKWWDVRIENLYPDYMRFISWDLGIFGDFSSRNWISLWLAQDEPCANLRQAFTPQVLVIQIMLGTGSINAGKSEMLRFTIWKIGTLLLGNLMLSQQHCCHNVKL